MKPFMLAASLICADMLNLEADIERLAVGKADYVHFDVMDGVFVPRFGLPPEVLRGLRRISAIPVDVHLMVADPEPYVSTFVDAGASIVTFHVESTKHASRVIHRIKAAGAEAGIALNPATGVEALDWLLDDLSLILVMAINPGIVGHKLIPNMIDKVGQLDSLLKRRNLDCMVEVDGGVTFDSAPQMLAAGASMLVCGSSTIFTADAPVDRKLLELREHLAGA